VGPCQRTGAYTAGARIIELGLEQLEVHISVLGLTFLGVHINEPGVMVLGVHISELGLTLLGVHVNELGLALLGPILMNLDLHCWKFRLLRGGGEAYVTGGLIFINWNLQCRGPISVHWGSYTCWRISVNRDPHYRRLASVTSCFCSV
jgi:hypothetical protein